MILGPSHDYKIGDDAWIYLGNHEGKMTKGKVVDVLVLPGWAYTNYVIEIDTPMDPLLEVRTAFAMRPNDPRLDVIEKIIQNGISKNINSKEIALAIMDEI